MVKEREDFIDTNVTSESHCLDAFYWKVLEGSSSFKKLAAILKIIVTLSHCKVSVERGFSVSKSLLVENRATKNLNAQRIVYDHIKVNNVSAEDLEICPTLRRNVKHARQRYSTYLGKQKKDKVQNDRSLKEKQVQEEITIVNKKKAMLENTIREFTNDADKYVMDAENVSKKEDMKTLRWILGKALFQKQMYFLIRLMPALRFC